VCQWLGKGGLIRVWFLVLEGGSVCYMAVSAASLMGIVGATLNCEWCVGGVEKAAC